MADDTPTPGNPPATATGTTGEVNDWRVDASRPNDIRIIAPNGETRVRADGLMTLGVHCAMAVGECDRLAAAVERLTRALKRIADASPTFRIQQMARAALASAPRPAPEPGARHDDTQEWKHDWQEYGVNGKCSRCGAVFDQWSIIRGPKTCPVPPAAAPGVEDAPGPAGSGRDGAIRLVKVQHEMWYAEGVTTTRDRYGTIYEFRDRTGKVHAQFQAGNPIAHPPENTIGAVREDDLSWWWVVRDAAPAAVPAGDGRGAGEGAWNPRGTMTECDRCGYRQWEYSPKGTRLCPTTPNCPGRVRVMPPAPSDAAAPAEGGGR